MPPILRYDGPWSFKRGQLRNKDGNVLACFPIFPNGMGGPEDLRNGQLCALLPEIIDCLVKSPMTARTKEILDKIAEIESKCD